MNDYLTPLTDIILASNGTVDKYMGDAIMAFWNAPLDDEDHARSACLTALAMCSALETFNNARRAAAERNGATYSTVGFGIGLNTGNCSVGNIGSVRRFDYSAIGDAVNVTSRLESLTKFYGLDILISEETQRGAPELAWLEVDLVRVKGRSTPVRVFTLVGDATHALSPEFSAHSIRHRSMLEAYRDGDFATAIAIAGGLAASNGPLRNHYERTAALYQDAAHRPPSSWNSIRTMGEK
jgi:adenylate cyclase